MSSTNVTAIARRVVIAMACGVALLSVAVFLVLFLVQHDTLLEAAVQAAPLAAIAMLSVYAATMVRCLTP
jgi:hypothetical protein